jgi:acyl-CoA reductase-like NAD-dependent aldehyde dehydrogenase
MRNATAEVPHLTKDFKEGPVQNQLQYKRLHSVWEEIKRSGAKVLFRGVVLTNTEGFFFPVRLLDNPPDGAGFIIAPAPLPPSRAPHTFCRS